MNRLENLLFALRQQQDISIHEQNPSEHNPLFEKLYNSKLQHAWV